MRIRKEEANVHQLPSFAPLLCESWNAAAFQSELLWPDLFCAPLHNSRPTFRLFEDDEKLIYLRVLCFFSEELYPTCFNSSRTSVARIFHSKFTKLTYFSSDQIMIAFLHISRVLRGRWLMLQWLILLSTQTAG